MMCSATMDLQGCMANLMWFQEEDILEIPLLEPAYDLPIASPTLEEGTLPISKTPEAQATATCPLGCEEWAPETESAASFGNSDRAPRCTKVSTTTRIQITTTGTRCPTHWNSQSWWDAEYTNASQYYEFCFLQNWNYWQTCAWVWNSVSQTSVSRVAQSWTNNYWAMSHQASDLLRSLYSIVPNK